MTVRKIWTFLSEFSGVITSIGLIVLGLKSFFIFLRSFNLSFWSIAVIFLILIVLIMFPIASWIKTTKDKYVSKSEIFSIEQDIKEYSKTNAGTASPRKLLPSNKLLKKWLSYLQKRAKKRSSDFQLVLLCFYIDVEGTTAKPNMQAIFYSPWLNEHMYCYAGENNTSECEENSFTSIYKTVITPFFIVYPKWKEIVVKAWEFMFNKVPQEYEVQLISIPNLRITFRYKSGNLSIEDIFVYENGKLIHKKSGNTIEVS